MTTIADTIESMYTAVGDAYDAVVEQGGVPVTPKNLQNLANSIKTIAPKVAMGDYGKLIWIEELSPTNEITKLGGMPISTEEEFNGLCTPTPGEGEALATSFTIGDKTISKANVVAFFSNQMPNEIADGFLRESSYLCYGAISIPNNVTSIGANFLRNCRFWDFEITFGTGLVSLGASFMQGCTTFNSPIDLSSTQLTAIPDNFLALCSTLNNTVTLPTAVESLGSFFLYGTSKFNKPLSFPTTLKTIGLGFMNLAYAFNQNIEILGGITSIGAQFLYKADMSTSSIHITGNDGVIGDYFCAFSNLGESSPITLDGTWTNTGEKFLMRCIGFDSNITITGNNLIIGSYFCYGGTYLEYAKITFNGSVKSIGDGFLYGCLYWGWGTSDMVIPNTVETIGKSFMYNCGNVLSSSLFKYPNASNIAELPFLENCTSIGIYFMGNCSTTTGSASGGDGDWGTTIKINAPKLTKIPDYFMEGCTSLRGPIDFSGCTGATSIGSRLMYDCSSLLGIVFPPNVKTIGSECLGNCSALINPVTIPNSVTSISTRFMRGCMAYSSPITIPSGCSVSSGYFMTDTANFVGPLVINGSLGNGGSNLVCRSDQCPSYTKGVAVTGTNGASFVNSLGTRKKYNDNAGSTAPNRGCRNVYIYDPDTDITAEDGAILITEKK